MKNPFKSIGRFFNNEVLGSGVGDVLSAIPVVGDIISAGRQRRAGELMQQNQLTQWNREDNATQRMLADYKAAGLNPILAAGGGGAASTLGSVVEAGQSGSQAIDAIMRAKQMKIQEDYNDGQLDVAYRSQKSTAALQAEQAKAAKAQADAAKARAAIDLYDLDQARKNKRPQVRQSTGLVEQLLQVLDLGADLLPNSVVDDVQKKVRGK